VKNEAPKTALDLFRIQEAKINSDVAESEKHYDRVIREQEGILAKARAEREAAAGVLKGMTADYEKIEAELEAEEARRLDSAGLTKKALQDGRIGAADYFKQGLTAGEVQARAAAVAGEKLADLRNTIRTKAVKLLEAEAAELEAEYNIAFARQAPAAAMRERLAGLLIALEASLASPIGIGGEPAVKALLDAKRMELQNATGKRLTSDGWKPFDLAALKRLRLDPTWPDSTLPEVEKIIGEIKTTGRPVSLRLNPNDRENPVGVMWD
jgi:hypothetical protein